MFEIVQVHHAGVSRRALRTIPPRFVTHEGNVNQVRAGATLVTPVIVPDDCQVVNLGWIRTVIHPAAMFSGSGKLALNPDQPYLLTETVIHELVHYHQRARMGPPSYAVTYTLQLPGAFIDSLRTKDSDGWHDHHLMEREARRIAREIITAHFYVDGLYRIEREWEPIDAVFEIEKRLPTRRKAA